MDIDFIEIDQADGGFQKVRLLGRRAGLYIKVYARMAAGSTPAQPAFLMTASITDEGFNALAHPYSPRDYAVAADTLVASLSLSQTSLPALEDTQPPEPTKGTRCRHAGRLLEARQTTDGGAEVAWFDFGPIAPEQGAAWADVQIALVDAAREVAAACAVWWSRAEALTVFAPAPTPEEEAQPA